MVEVTQQVIDSAFVLKVILLRLEVLHGRAHSKDAVPLLREKVEREKNKNEGMGWFFHMSSLLLYKKEEKEKKKRRHDKTKQTVDYTV